MNRASAYSSCALICLLALVPACGPGLGSPSTVTGRVTIDGEALNGAIVTFHCTQERTADLRTFTTTADENGQYTIEKVYPGSYRVGVGEPAPMQEEDTGVVNSTEGAKLKPANGGELCVEVASDDVVFDVQMTKRPVGRARR